MPRTRFTNGVANRYNKLPRVTNRSIRYYDLRVDLGQNWDEISWYVSTSETKKLLEIINLIRKLVMWDL